MNDRGRQGARIRAPHQASTRRRTGGRRSTPRKFADDKGQQRPFPGRDRHSSTTLARASRVPEKGAGGVPNPAKRPSSVVRVMGSLKRLDQQEKRLGREVRRRSPRQPGRAAATKHRDQPRPRTAQMRPSPPLAPASQRHAPPNLPTKPPPLDPLQTQQTTSEQRQPQPRNEPHLASITLSPIIKKTTKPKTTTQTSLSKQTQIHKPQPNPPTIQTQPQSNPTTHNHC
jgi:hypothetical protein